MLGAKVHKLRAATRPIAFIVLRWSVYGSLVAALLSMPMPLHTRDALIRIAFAFFGASMLGFTVHFTLVSIDAALKRDSTTAVGMLFFIAICAFIVFIGFHTAAVGLAAH